ncbi:MAG TPA: class I SAM-dependent methyltransferase [Gemmatimonadales bacterium]|jgi:cyclopropane-fatty-acyl-phospholipid synthase|nr:class I SAM-dependent methyltransferase [Gemmatimonadales bacterium]
MSSAVQQPVRPEAPRSNPPETPAPPVSPDSSLARNRNALTHLFGPVETRTFAVRFWDSGVSDTPARRPPAFTLVLSRPSSLRAMLVPPSQLRLGEAYVRGEFEVEGNLEAATRLGEQMRDRFASVRFASHALRLLLRLPGPGPRSRLGRRGNGRSGQRHSLARDAHAIRSHYDVGNEFYALWLDPAMVYSCAYFRTGTESLAEAQRAKLDHICRKLRLQRGDRLLDIGCGWGGLIMHAAREYGVRAFGITLSPSQAAWAGDHIRAASLQDRCAVEVRDYRALNGLEPFDKVVSVGMCEHVGHAQLPGYFEAAWKALRPGGLFLNHCIVSGQDPLGGRQRSLRKFLWREGRFTDRHVFPDGQLPVLGPMLEVAEAQGFETRDVESLREHYATTLRQWVERLEAARKEAIELTSPETYRTWRIYMANSARQFTAGRLGLAQALLARPDARGAVGLPGTREDLYRD